MGWSGLRVVQRYQHVIDDLRIEASARIGRLLQGPERVGDKAQKTSGAGKAGGPTVTSSNETTAAPECQGCPFNKATHIARGADRELLLCECCAEAHDEADGWTVVDLSAATSELPTSRTSSSPDRTQQVPEPGAS